MWLTPGVRRVLAYREPVDVRKSFPGLIGLLKGVLVEDPLLGSVFIFINRRGTLIKSPCDLMKFGVVPCSLFQPR
jgi:transposase